MILSGGPCQGPFTILRPGDNRQVALLAGRHRLVARPTGAPPGRLPSVSWDRQIDVDPRVQSFRLQFNEVDFKSDAALPRASNRRNPEPDHVRRTLW